MFRGNFQAKVDEKGRLKIPTRFRDTLRKQYGDEVYVTCFSTKGEYLRVYPLSVWQRIEQSLARIPLTEPARQPFEDAVSYYGLESKMDPQGRVLVSQILRQTSQVEGQEVCVLGKGNFLEVWRLAAFKQRLRKTPSTNKTLHRLSQYPVWDDGGGQKT
jgi:MraZ protein